MTAALSEDARTVAACWGQVAKLAFSNVFSIPSPRAQAGLDELVEAGYFMTRREGFADVYYRTKDMREFLRWFIALKEHPDFEMLTLIRGD